METTVILTHRSKDSKTSNKSKIKNSKLSQYQQAWGVSEETAKLMLKRERIMKGQTFVLSRVYSNFETKGRQPVRKKKNAPIKSTQSEIDVKSPPKRDKTWIPSTHSEQGRNSRLEHWLSSVDAGRGVTPSLSEPDQQNSNHFSSAHRQLGQGQLLLRNRD